MVKEHIFNEIWYQIWVHTAGLCRRINPMCKDIQKPRGPKSRKIKKM